MANRAIPKLFAAPTLVTLNLGLDGPIGGGAKLSQEDRLDLYRKTLSELMEVYETRIGESCTEPTLIVVGVFKTDAFYSTMLYDMVCVAEQDCIAMYAEDYRVGKLFGPNADAWGEFNLEYFIK